MDLRALLGRRALGRVLRQSLRDDVLGLAAQLAFFFTLALFPFLLMLLALLGTFSSERLADDLLGYFVQVLPATVYELLDTYTADVLRGENPAPGLLSFGILGTVWAASGAFAALIKALNRAYDVVETRPFWKVRGIAILMTLGLSGVALAAILLLVFGPAIGQGVAGYFGLGREFVVLWGVVRWPVALGFLVVVLALVYYFAPAARQPLRWITPGGLVAVALWVLASLAFNYYVGEWGSYDETYGSIGAAIVLLLYLYVVSLTILLGAELNAVLMRMKEEASGREVLKGEFDDERRTAEKAGDGIRGR